MFLLRIDFLADVAITCPNSKRRRLQCNRVLCLLEWSWAISWKGWNFISSNYTVFAITTLGRYCNISQMFVELSVHQFFVCCWLVVLFWRTVWYSEVHQDCSASWNAHDSANWSFCCGRVELRVMLFLYNPSFITNSFPFVVFVIESCGYRGVPVWLHYVPGTVFRADNEPWKVRMDNIAEFVLFPLLLKIHLLCEFFVSALHGEFHGVYSKPVEKREAFCTTGRSNNLVSGKTNDNI